MIAAEPHERWLFRKLTLTIRGGCNVTVASPLEQDHTTENTLLATLVSTNSRSQYLHLRDTVMIKAPTCTSHLDALCKVTGA